MADDARGIFPISTESASIGESYTMATGTANFTTRSFLEDRFSSDEMALFIKTADDDGSTPTIKVYIQLYNGTGWMTATQIGTAAGYSAGSEIQISSYGADWWIKNKGVRFYVTKTGAGAVTFTEARWI